MRTFEQDMSFAIVTRNDRDKQVETLELGCPMTGLCQGFEGYGWVGHRVWAARSMSKNLKHPNEWPAQNFENYFTGLTQRHRDYLLGLDRVFPMILWKGTPNLWAFLLKGADAGTTCLKQKFFQVGRCS